MADKKKLQAVENEKMEPDKEGAESGEEESREQLLRGREDDEEGLDAGERRHGGRQRFANAAAGGQTPAQASVVLDAEALGASLPVASGKPKGVHLKEQAQRSNGTRPRDKQNKVDFVVDDADKANAEASFITLAGDQIGVAQGSPSATTFAGAKGSSSIKKSSSNGPSSKITVKKSLKKDAKPVNFSKAAAPEGAAPIHQRQRASVKQDPELPASAIDDNGASLANDEQAIAPAGSQHKVEEAHTRGLHGQAEADFGKTSASMQQEQEEKERWIMY